MTAPRVSAASGSFYPADKIELSTEIDKALKNAKTFEPKDIHAIIVPHAGYIYSAEVAATAYKTLHKKYKNIFLLGSSHHVNFNGVSIYNQGNYQTPLGEVQVNATIVGSLLSHNDSITYKSEAHAKEHTLEVQLPFLQTIYGKELRIVPIIMATSELSTIEKLAQSLSPYFNDENLFIISTDLSHYPSYTDAQRVDANIINALIKNSKEALLNAIVENENSHTSGLVTSACGWSALLTLLSLTQKNDYKYELLAYKNSGDSPYGDKQRVVGYSALRVYKEQKTKSRSFSLNLEEKKELKSIVVQALREAVLKNKRLELDPSKLPLKFQEPLGAFVTLHLHKQLKGCIGRFEPKEPLYRVLIDMAIAASRNDRRFTPVTPSELEELEVEISILTPRVKANSIDDIIIGKHGIYLQYGSKNGTYLPQVAKDMHWSKEQFLQSCCQEKAGINPDDCKKAELYLYEAIVF